MKQHLTEEFFEEVMNETAFLKQVSDYNGDITDFIITKQGMFNLVERVYNLGIKEGELFYEFKRRN